MVSALYRTCLRSLLVLGLGAFSFPGIAETLSDQMTQLKRPDWHLRQQAFKKLEKEPVASPQGETAVKFALFDLLARANTYMEESQAGEQNEGELIDLLSDQKGSTTRDSAYSAYYAELINWVGH